MTRIHVNIPLILSPDIDSSLAEQEIVEANDGADQISGEVHCRVRLRSYEDLFSCRSSRICQTLGENQGSEQCNVLKATGAKAAQTPCPVIHSDGQINLGAPQRPLHCCPHRCNGSPRSLGISSFVLFVFLSLLSLPSSVATVDCGRVNNI